MKKIIGLLTATGIGLSAVPLVNACTTTKETLTSREELLKLIEEANKLKEKDGIFESTIISTTSAVNQSGTSERELKKLIEELKIEFINYDHSGYREAWTKLHNVIEKTDTALKVAAGNENDHKPSKITKELMEELKKSIRVLNEEVEPRELNYQTIILNDKLHEFDISHQYIK